MSAVCLECRVFIAMLRTVMLIVVILKMTMVKSVVCVECHVLRVMLNAVMLSIIILNVVVLIIIC